jgi:hypothetical protein
VDLTAEDASEISAIAGRPVAAAYSETALSLSIAVSLRRMRSTMTSKRTSRLPR